MTDSADLLHPLVLWPIVGRSFHNLERDVFEASILQLLFVSFHWQEWPPHLPKCFVYQVTPSLKGRIFGQRTIVTVCQRLHFDDLNPTPRLQSVVSLFVELCVIGDRSDEELLVDEVETIVTVGPMPTLSVNCALGTKSFRRFSPRSP